MLKRLIGLVLFVLCLSISFLIERHFEMNFEIQPIGLNRPYHDEFLSDKGYWVRYNQNEELIKGWHSTQEGTYYFDIKTGEMAKGKVVIDGHQYIFDKVTGIVK